MLLIVVAAPITAFLFAWSLGRMGDHALARPRHALRNSLVIAALMTALFVVQAIASYSDDPGLGFWIPVAGVAAGIANVAFAARELRQTRG